MKTGLAACNGPPTQNSDARVRNESVRRALRWRFSEVGELVGMCLEILEEAFELLLHGVHLLAHVHNDFYAREIHAQVASQRQDQFKSFEIRIRVKTRVAFRARRL